MTITNNATTRAATIAIASRRVDIAKKDRDRALINVKEDYARLEESQAALEIREEELRIEQFTLGLLINQLTNNGGDE